MIPIEYILDYILDSIGIYIYIYIHTHTYIYIYIYIGYDDSNWFNIFNHIWSSRKFLQVTGVRPGLVPLLLPSDAWTRRICPKSGAGWGEGGTTRNGIEMKGKAPARETPGAVTTLDSHSVTQVCLKIGYIPNYSHLIGIMIINHWV